MNPLVAFPGEVALFFVGLIGLMVGSFLNVVIHRLPQMMERGWRAECAELRGDEPQITATFNLLRPGSHCPQCQSPIRAWENIPVLSYLILRGHCGHCSARISPRYPIVELVTALLSVTVIAHFGPTLAGLGGLCLLWSLIALTGIDFDKQLLPDSITLPLLWLGLLLNLNSTYVNLHTAVIGAALGYLTLWSVYWAFKLITGKEGMGYGDFKLLAALGAWLGFQMLPLIILLSSAVGAVVGISLMVFCRRGRDIPIPFGPYLAAAGAITLIWGQPITATYFALLRI